MASSVTRVQTADRAVLLTTGANGPAAYRGFHLSGPGWSRPGFALVSRAAAGRYATATTRPAPQALAVGLPSWQSHLCIW